MRQGGGSHTRGTTTAWTPGSMEFEFTGNGALRVTGPMTGLVYVFDGHGSRAVVYSADVASLATNPYLTPVR